MTKPLTPPDFKRCQAERTIYNAFVMGGPTRTTERCSNTSAFVATEKRPGPDGQQGAMAVCAECRGILEKQVEDGKAPAVKFTKVRQRAERKGGPPAMTTTRIVRVTQSPMSPQLWCCDLSCGHECWVTQKRKPSTGKTMTCPKCTERKDGQR